MKCLIPRRYVISSAGLCCGLLAMLLSGAARAGVIAHWSFDNLDPDGTYHDSANNAHPATPADKSMVQAYSGTAKFANAVTFLGPANPNSYLTIPPLNNIQTTSLTVAAWVNLATPDQNIILADWPSMAQSAYSFGFHPFGTPNTARPTANLTSVETGGGRGTSGNNRRSIVVQQPRQQFVPLNEWHHFAWTWNRETGTLTSYLDGTTLVETKRTPPNTNLSQSLDVAVNNRPVRIGSQEFPVTGSMPAIFSGSLDELWIFDEVLYPIQLKNLIKYNDFHGPAATPLATTTESIGRAGPDPGPTTGGLATATDMGPSATPSAGPGPTASPVVGSTSVQRPSPGRVAGILMCLTVIVAAACYLVWAFAERAKLRTRGGYR